VLLLVLLLVLPLMLPLLLLLLFLELLELLQLLRVLVPPPPRCSSSYWQCSPSYLTQNCCWSPCFQVFFLTS